MTWSWWSFAVGLATLPGFALLLWLAWLFLAWQAPERGFAGNCKVCGKLFKARARWRWWLLVHWHFGAESRACQREWNKRVAAMKLDAMRRAQRARQ